MKRCRVDANVAREFEAARSRVEPDGLRARANAPGLRRTERSFLVFEGNRLVVFLVKRLSLARVSAPSMHTAQKCEREREAGQNLRAQWSSSPSAGSGAGSAFGLG